MHQYAGPGSGAPGGGRDEGPPGTHVHHRAEPRADQRPEDPAQQDTPAEEGHHGSVGEGAVGGEVVAEEGHHGSVGQWGRGL